MVIGIWSLGLWAPQARAQDESVIIGQLKEEPRFYYEPVEFALTLQSWYTRDTIDEAERSRRFEQVRTEELLEARTRGHVVHPRFFDFSLAGSVGLQQLRARDNGSRSREGTELYEYDARATMLRYLETPVTIYGRRQRSLVNRTFGPSLETITDVWGAAVELDVGQVRTRLEGFQTETTQDGLAGRTDFSLTQQTFLWNSRYDPDPYQSWSWDYEYNDIQQRRRLFGSSFQTHTAQLTHSIDFGPEKQHDLTSRIRLFDQSGDFALRSFRLDETLRLRHTDRFDTRLRYTFEDRTNRNSTLTRHRGTARFRHRLYDSLVTTGTIGAQETRFGDNSTSTEAFGNLGFDYRKRVPFGIFNSLLSAGFRRQESEQRAEPVQVVDELRAFEDSLPIVITGPEVVPGSLIVTDPSGLIVFTPGLDYTVTPFADRVEISRVIGGRIDAGQAVLLDYLLAPLPRHVINTNSFSLGGRYTIREGPLTGLGFYTRYAIQDQRIQTDLPQAFAPNDFTDLLYGAEYRRGPWTLTAERQHRDADILPFDATRFTGRWRQRVGIDTTLALNSAYSIIDFTATDNQTTLFTLSSQLHHRFNGRMSGTLTVMWRDQDDRLFGRTQGLEQQAELNWRHRQTQLYFQVRNAQLHGPARDSSFQLIQFGLRREF